MSQAGMTNVAAIDLSSATPAPDIAPSATPAGIVLASTSEARRRLLGEIVGSFVSVAPTCDEHAIHGQTPSETALLRALAKAESVRASVPRGALVIGSDQLVELDGIILGKPGTEERACAQLGQLAGRTHRLITAVVLLGPDLREEHIAVHLLTMRPLDAREIAEYVALDRPEACAGSYRFESRGAALMSTVLGGDRTAIQGLPLRALSAMLHRSRGATLDGPAARIHAPTATPAQGPTENVRSR
jgi:septum formation protein